MKIQITQDDLNKGLTLASRMTASRGQLPILANVQLLATKEGLQILATNLEIGIRINIGGKVSDPGATTVPAKSLAEFVSSLASGTISLETDGDKLKVVANKSQASFAGIPATEFPHLPSKTEDEKDLVLLANFLSSV
jgi:DNA polymerase-3 subunit beta